MGKVCVISVCVDENRYAMCFKGVNSSVTLRAGQSAARVLCFLLGTTFAIFERDTTECVQRGLVRRAKGLKAMIQGTERPGDV